MPRGLKAFSPLWHRRLGGRHTSCQWQQEHEAAAPWTDLGAERRQDPRSGYRSRSLLPGDPLALSKSHPLQVLPSSKQHY